MSADYKKIAFHTMGCKLNFSETSMISKDFLSRGFERVKYNEYADFYILNTCSVTDNADKEARKLIRQAKRSNPNSKIAVIGCYAQLNPNEISSIKGVDLVVGSEKKFNLLNELDKLNLGNGSNVISSDIKEINTFIPSYSIGDRTRSYLKIQDGCDYVCSFCTIPLARGKSRSDSIRKTINLANQAIDEGAKELVLTGVNIGDFGKQAGENFFDLIQELDKLNIDRLRISSIEPNLLSKEIIEFCSISNKFMPHFHIPLQSGSDEILTLMQRRYKRSRYLECVSVIKDLIPDATIGADIIVGFPGESDDNFNETLQFVKKLNISYLHVFTYSERANTRAINFENKVDKKIRLKRSLILRNFSKKILEEHQNKFIKSSRPVLFEYLKNDKIFGYTDNYIKVAVDANHSIINTIKNVRLRSSNGNYIVGELAN
jgi:threonylcarbamoyladenosine tRNA methylthiotransferase MtaB